MQAWIAAFYARMSCIIGQAVISSVAMSETPLQRAIRLAGGSRKLAEKLNVTRQAVEQWAECPPTRVLELERLSDVSRHELRPDVFGEPTPEREGAAA